MRSPTRRPLSNAAAHVAAHRGNIATFRLILGALVLGFFLLALMMDVQTSEAFLLNGGKVTFAALDWAIVLQPLDLFEGHIRDLSLATEER